MSNQDTYENMQQRVGKQMEAGPEERMRGLQVQINELKSALHNNIDETQTIIAKQCRQADGMSHMSKSICQLQNDVRSLQMGMPKNGFVGSDKYIHDEMGPAAPTQKMTVQELSDALFSKGTPGGKHFADALGLKDAKPEKPQAVGMEYMDAYSADLLFQVGRKDLIDYIKFLRNQLGADATPATKRCTWTEVSPSLHGSRSFVRSCVFGTYSQNQYWRVPEHCGTCGGSVKLQQPPGVPLEDRV